MNKINSIVATLLLLLTGATVWGQETVRLNFEESEAGTLNNVLLSDASGFKVVAESDRTNAKVEASSLNFAYSSTDEAVEWSATKRWLPDCPLNQSGRTMTITVPKNGKLNVYVRSGNKTATDRALVLTQGDEEIVNKVIKDEDAFKIGTRECFPIVSVDVEAGDITVNTTNTINFYGFAFTPTAATSVDVEITDAKYATFANNTSSSLALPTGLTAFGVSAVSEGVVTFTKYNVIPVGVGVILNGNAGTYTLDPTDTECTYTGDNLLVAVTTDMTVPEKVDGKLNYIFANKTQGVGFYKSSGTGTISKGKAYLSITDESVDNREWDFTTKKIWSDATIANLEVERQKTEGVVWTTNAGSADDGWRYMYNAATTTEEMTANGEKIAELEGLFFRGSANRLGIDNRSTNRFYLAGNKFYVVIPDLKAGSTVSISTKSSANGTNYAYMTCDDTENVSRSGSTEALEVDNVFTIGKFGSYEFQPNRGLYITKITVSSEGGAAAREFIGFEDNTTTSISAIQNEHAVTWYTLNGVRVAQPTTKGIYVKNGKKFIVK